MIPEPNDGDYAFMRRYYACNKTAFFLTSSRAGNLHMTNWPFEARAYLSRGKRLCRKIEDFVREGTI